MLIYISPSETYQPRALGVSWRRELLGSNLFRLEGGESSPQRVSVVAFSSRAGLVMVILKPGFDVLPPDHNLPSKTITGDVTVLEKGIYCGPS